MKYFYTLSVCFWGKGEYSAHLFDNEKNRLNLQAETIRGEFPEFDKAAELFCRVNSLELFGQGPGHGPDYKLYFLSKE